MKKGSKKRTRFDEYIGLPINGTLKQQIAELANDDERNPTDMTRILLREAVAARKAAESKEAATAGAE